MFNPNFNNMKKLQILLTLSMSLMLFTAVKATNFVDLAPSKEKAPQSITAIGLDKYWGFSDQTYRPKFTGWMRLVDWGQNVSLADDYFVFDTDTIPTSIPLTVSSSYTYSIRVVADYSVYYCNRTNPPYVDSIVYAFIQSTGSTPYYYKNVVAEPDCNAPAERTLTGTIPAGTYKISIIATGDAIGSAWW